MDWRGYVGWAAVDHANGADAFEALAEHYAISRTPLARGLKVINTDRATVPMRCVVCY